MDYAENKIVSVIVPVYNVEKYLEQCVDQLRKQTYSNIEIILIDDGATDSSGKLCDDLAILDNRIKVIHKTNGGLSDARNVGIRSSTGAYITCIDSDDLVTRDYIEVLIEAAVNNDCDISIGTMVGIYDVSQENNFLDVRVYRKKKPIKLNSYETLRIMLLQNEFDVSACAKLYKRELFEDTEYPVGKLYEDLATTYKLVAKTDRIVYCDQIIYGYRQNRPGSITSTSFNVRRLELLESYHGFYTFIKKKYSDLTNEAECRYAACVTGILESLYSSDCGSKYNDIEYKMKRMIRKRVSEILRQKDLLFRRKVKMIFAGLGKRPYMLLYRAYYNK